jgi:hypothetical protein
LSVAYLICLGIKYYQPSILGDLSLTFIVGSILLFLFALLGVMQDESHQVGLNLVVLFQIAMIFNSGPLIDFSSFDIMRLTCLAFMIIITGANYVENSRHLGFEFWSVIDLLVLLIFSGLVILQLNGLDVAIWKWAEVILFYYSLGLYIQHRHPRAAVKSLGAVATG